MKTAKLKPVLIIGIILALLLLWAVIGIVDYSRVVNDSKKPVFCKQTLVFLDGGSGHYTGLGYSFDIKGDFIGENARGVTEYSYYIFGKRVEAAISCS